MKEEELTVEHVDYKDLTKANLISILVNKDNVIETMTKVLNDKDTRFQSMLNDYKKDHDYLTTLNKNVVSYYKRKEGAITSILENLIVLNNLDATPIAPEYKEEEVEHDKDSI